MGHMGMDERDLQQARKAERRRGRVQALSDQELFRRQWAQNMVTYWQERIDRLRINNTGALRSSIVGYLHPGNVTTIEHQFLLYGKYVSDGVAREFGEGYTDSLGRYYASSRGGEGTWNGGQLPFLLPGGEQYREEHGLDKPKRVGPAWGGRVAGGKPHVKRDWFFRKYYSSRMVLNEMEAAAFGREYQGMMTMAFDELFQQRRML